MRTAGLLLLGATPGVAIGYLLLLGYIMGRVKPLPITFLPETEAPSAPSRPAPARELAAV
jgi:hypothetical protein